MPNINNLIVIVLCSIDEYSNTGLGLKLNNKKGLKDELLHCRLIPGFDNCFLRQQLNANENATKRVRAVHAARLFFLIYPI